MYRNRRAGPSCILRFTNMSTLLILAGVIIFLMGLLSEQLTNLQYKDTSEDPD